MKVTIAIDSLKGSLSSMEAGRAAAEGIKRVYPDARLHVRPLADGGEGTVEALKEGTESELRTICVTGPLGKPVLSDYVIMRRSRTAVIEMAKAAGLPLTAPEERNPLLATTYGVGELIMDAIRQGCRRFVVGIGGSATNDGGVGMLQALRFGMLDQQGRQVSPGAQGLAQLKSITVQNAVPELKDCLFRVACDVTNPLCGPRGASAVFGPQKGATPEMAEQMDRWLWDYACLAKKIYPDLDTTHPGAGAAGGLGFAFLAFTHASLEAGAGIVLDETHLENYIRESDIVITGEGRLDGQTVMGKAPISVARLAKKYKKPVIALAGTTAPDASTCNIEGIDAFFPILHEITTLEKAMDPETARTNLTLTSEQIFRLIRSTSKNILP